MPLNLPSLSEYKPAAVGPVKLATRSATRSRLTTGGTYFRSKARGEQENLIRIGAFEDGAEGVLVVHNTNIKPAEQISATGVSPELQIFKLDLAWNEELRFAWNGSTWRAAKHGIRWQIAPGGPPFGPTDLGLVKDGLLNFGFAILKLTGVGSWPTGATVVLRPRTYRFTLVPLSVTDPTTSVVSTGWDIDALRGALNGSTAWVTMPGRGTAGGDSGPPTPGTDVQDTGVDAPVLTVFPMKNLTGGDGLPSTPAGINTGPARVLVHLNYSELENGSMGEFNQVFEWVGESATIGAWERYA